MRPRRAEPVLIVGAGPAGLATAAMLQRAGIASRILEAGPAAGHSWARYYDRLRLHTGRRISGLPGYPLPRNYPVFVSRPAYLRYLHAYARRFNLLITPNQRVLRAERVGDLWRLTTADTVWEAPVLVAASGIAANPAVPPIPGLSTYGDRVLHSSAYQTAAPFAGQDVLVVGVGNSGTEIALDLARVARQVTLAVRSPIAIVPRRLFGLPISYFAIGLSYLPPRLRRGVRALLSRRWLARLRAAGLEAGAPDQFPVIGLEILDAIAAGRVTVAPGIDRFTPTAVAFADGTQRRFDAVVLATGFRPALDYLAPYITMPDEKQAHLDIQAAPAVPDLYFVGFYYDGLRGALYLIGRQAQEVARRIRRSGAARLPDAWVAASAEG
jgi:cation diffusion facilitator CzcD-associated flavoprotein CzcO